MILHSALLALKYIFARAVTGGILALLRGVGAEFERPGFYSGAVALSGAGGEYGPVERSRITPGGDASLERWR